MSTTAISSPLPASKWIRVIYWGSTGLISAMMLMSAYMYFTPEFVSNFEKMGFPNFFRIELAIAKLIGVAVLLAPGLDRLRDWAYAGFTITFVSAFILHVTAGDPIGAKLMPLIALGMLLVSYVSFRRGARS